MIYIEFSAVFTALFLETSSVSLEQRGSCLQLPPGTGLPPGLQLPPGAGVKREPRKAQTLQGSGAAAAHAEPGPARAGPDPCSSGQAALRNKAKSGRSEAKGQARFFWCE